jgi:hypothetical protein
MCCLLAAAVIDLYNYIVEVGSAAERVLDFNKSLRVGA